MPAETPSLPQPDAPNPAGPVDPARRFLTPNHSDLVRAALIVVFVLLGLQFLWAARFLALTGFIGILFGLGASPAVDALERKGVRRGVGSPLIIFGLVAVLFGIGVWSAPTLVDQSRELRTRFPEAVDKAELWLANHQPRLLDALTGTDSTAAAITPGAEPTPELSVGPAAAVPRQGRLVQAMFNQAPRFKAAALGILTSTLAAVGGFVLVIFISVYIAAEPDLYRRGLLLLFSPPTRRRLAPVLTAISVKLRRWLSTQFLAMLVIGVVTTIVLSVIGVRAAVPLGVIAGLLEFIPNIGPTLSAIPAIAMAFVDSPQKTLAVVVAYWGIQFLENNLLIPYLMKEQLDLPPALTMMVQVVMAYLFGLLGLFVATPLLAAVFVMVQMLVVEADPDEPTAPALIIAAADNGDSS